MCQGWDPAWAYMVPCYDWPPASSGGRATPGVLAVESYPSCRQQQASCLVPCGTAVACLHKGLALFASCAHQKPSAITGRARTALADRHGDIWQTELAVMCLPSHLRAFQGHGCGSATVPDGITRAAPGPAPCPCWPKPRPKRPGPALPWRQGV